MRRLVYLMGILTVLSLLGCAARNVPLAHIPYVDTNYSGAKLVIGSKKLLGKVILKDAKLRKVGNFTQAEVTVQNTTNKVYELEYLFEWEDNQGFNVDEVKVWKPFVLTPYQVRKFTSTGPVPEATRITFTIRVPYSKF